MKEITIDGKPYLENPGMLEIFFGEPNLTKTLTDMDDEELRFKVKEYISGTLEQGIVPTKPGLAIYLGESTKSIERFIATKESFVKNAILIHVFDQLDDHAEHAFMNGFGSHKGLESYLRNFHNWDNKEVGALSSNKQGDSLLTIVDDTTNLIDQKPYIETEDLKIEN